MKAVTGDQMRTIEQRSVEAGVSLDELMEQAGLAVADELCSRIEQVYGSRVTILVGPGNNGSDGLVAGRHLARRGAKVKAFALTSRPDPDEKRGLAEQAGVEFVTADNSSAKAIRASAAHSDVVVDAVLGTGRGRPIEQPLAGVFAAVREAARSVVAVDLPTFINADSGQFDPNGLRADLTLMLGYPKIGPLVTAGNGACGEIKVLDIGIPAGLADDAPADLLTPNLASSMLPARPLDANKGSFGKTIIVGGSRNYVGAPMLSTSTALRSGAGLVHLATPEPVYQVVAGKIPEAIYLPLAASKEGGLNQAAVGELLAAAEGMDSMLVGPGIGQSPGSVAFVEQLMRNLPENTPVVVDADALNIVSRMPGWSGSISNPLVLTPHPGEMARLLKSSVPEVQNDRPAAALEAASRFNATVVLKGAATLIATPSGALRVSPWVNSGLAKGGTGDVLAGLVAGLLAQNPSATFDAASLGVYLHGMAGEIARAESGERGMTAGDVAAALPAAFKELEQATA